MPYNVGSSLPEYRVKAALDQSDSGNRIQDDDFARRYGFRAGLVPGVSVFAYMSRPLVDLMGKDWLERGSAEAHFLRPIYEGEEIRIAGAITSIGDDGTLSLDYRATNSQDVPCGAGSALLPPAASLSEPPVDGYPAGRPKLHRAISLESLQVGEYLAPVTSDFTWNVHWQYCRKTIRDHHPLYEKTMHPGWLASRAGQILSANYAIPAWIDVSSAVENYHALEEECAVETRGRVYGKFERDGDHYIVLDLAVFSPAHCLATLRHTAIFHIAPNAA